MKSCQMLPLSEESLEKYSTDLNDLLSQLNNNQLRFVVALQEHPTKKAAAEAIGLEPNTVYSWPPIVDEAARMFALNEAATAMAIRRRALVKAMMVKVAGLNSKDPNVHQKVATEIIEWELGHAVQPVDIAVKGYAIISPDDWDAIEAKKLEAGEDE